MMMFIGVIVLIIGAGGFLLAFTGAGGELLTTLDKMPGGLIGWAVVAVVGLLVVLFNRRPAD